MGGTPHLLQQLQEGDRRALARAISLVENNAPEADALLAGLEINHGIPVTGITGPPGAGKSTLVSALVGVLEQQNPSTRIAVLAVDPSSPFTRGALLGDRLRMTAHHNNPNIYIRSLATRGALGGLSARTMQVTDLLKAAEFDHIIIETVGVGQSEVEIITLADTTVVVLVPESGDEVQTLKSGLMEIADIFVVNKADRQGAEILEKNLLTTLKEHATPVPVIRTVATTGEGVMMLAQAIAERHQSGLTGKASKGDLLYRRALNLAGDLFIKRFDTEDFRRDLLQAATRKGFNLYRFVSDRVAP